MKKICILIALPFMCCIALSAQITQEQADKIVLEHLSQESVPYALFAKEDVQENMIITTITGEILELDYPCWVYYIMLYLSDSHRYSGYYLIVKEANGNVLEIKPTRHVVPRLAEWRNVMSGYKQITGYLVGYETCGLTIENGEGQAKGYIFISEDLKDTLAVYNLPQDIFVFPAEIFPTTNVYEINVSFPEEYRNVFKVQLGYTVSSDQELRKLGLLVYCILNSFEMTRITYKNPIPVIVNSANKIE